MGLSIELYITNVDGTPNKDVTIATPGLVLHYTLDYQAPVDCTPNNDLLALTSPWTERGIIHKGYGLYRFDAPDAAFIGKVSFQGEGTNLIILPVIVGRVVEPNGSLTDIQALRSILAGVLGVTSGEGKVFHDPSGASQIAEEVISGNNRTSVTLTPNA